MSSRIRACSLAIVVGVLSSAAGCQPGERCGAAVSSCGGKGSYTGCTDGTTCRVLASDGSAFACASCADCQAAFTTAASWCGPGGASGAVTLSVGKVGLLGTIAHATPSAGRSFVTIDLTLGNGSVPAPIPAAFAWFSVATAAGLSFAASPLSASLTTPCAADTSVNPGAQYQCQVVFELPSQDAPAVLHYDDKRGDTASAMVGKLAPPSACEQLALWDQATPAGGNACSTCVVSAEEMPNGPCYSKWTTLNGCMMTANLSCLSGCQSRSADAVAACACDDGCDCAAPRRALEACAVAACASTCK